MTELKTQTELDDAVKGERVFVFFYAPWFEPSRQIKDLIPLLRNEFNQIQFYVCNADTFRTEHVKKVPTALLYVGGRLCETIEAVNVQMLKPTLQKMLDLKPNVLSDTDALNARIEHLINSDRVKMFIKGSKEQPFCKFSKEAVGLLNSLNVKYSTFDVFSDESVREGIKKYSDFPTFPQLYVQGELIGGIDIIKDLHEQGELVKALQEQ